MTPFSIFSIFDIISDILLFAKYVESDPWFARLTFLFVSLPSLNVLATLYGPRTAGAIGFVWGLVMLIVGVILIIAIDQAVIDGAKGSAWDIAEFLVLLGGSFAMLGLVMAFTMIISLISAQVQGGNIRSFIEVILSLVSSLFLQGLTFPLLLPFAPFIYIFLKGVGILKPRNQLLKAQSTLGGRGESILEAAPQFALQCYIILSELTPPGWIKWFSICTSALTISLKNIEHYVTARLEEEKKGKRNKNEEFGGIFKFKMQYSKSQQELKLKPKEKCLVNPSTDTFEEFCTRNSIELTSRGLTSMELASFELKSNDETFGPMSILKNIAVFFLASLFKILILSIFCVFFKGGTMVIIVGHVIVLRVSLWLCIRACSHKWSHLLEEKHWVRELGESYLGWLTITNLGVGKAAAFLRLVTTLYCTIAHTITLTVILAICNTDPSNVDVLVVKWTHLPLVQDLTTLNILLISTICLGWLSLVLDVITAAVRYHYRSRDTKQEQEEEASFWDGAILMEGLKF